MDLYKVQVNQNTHISYIVAQRPEIIERLFTLKYFYTLESESHFQKLIQPSCLSLLTLEQVMAGQVSKPVFLG